MLRFVLPLVLAVQTWMPGVKFTVPALLDPCPACGVPCAAYAVPESSAVRVIFHTFRPGGLFNRAESLTDTTGWIRRPFTVVRPGRWVEAPVTWPIFMSAIAVDSAGNRSCPKEGLTQTLATMGPGVISKP